MFVTVTSLYKFSQTPKKHNLVVNSSIKQIFHSSMQLQSRYYTLISPIQIDYLVKTNIICSQKRPILTIISIIYFIAFYQLIIII